MKEAAPVRQEPGLLMVRGYGMIRNILFDMDDTLLDFKTAEKAALCRTLGSFGFAPSPEDAALYSRLNAEQWALLECKSITRAELKVRRFDLFFKAVHLDVSPEEAAARYETELSWGHFFIDGAEALLRVLYGRFRLYLVSNGTARVQQGRMESAGLARWFDDIFISENIGVDKPDSRFFAFCFSRIPDFRRDETVIVGDRLSSDIEGGKNAGIKAVWFNPHHTANDTDVVPDREIRSLAELPPLLETL